MQPTHGSENASHLNTVSPLLLQAPFNHHAAPLPAAFAFSSDGSFMSSPLSSVLASSAVPVPCSTPGSTNTPSLHVPVAVPTSTTMYVVNSSASPSKSLSFNIPPSMPPCATAEEHIANNVSVTSLTYPSTLPTRTPLVAISPLRVSSANTVAADTLDDFLPILLESDPFPSIAPSAALASICELDDFIDAIRLPLLHDADLSGSAHPALLPITGVGDIPYHVVVPPVHLPVHHSVTTNIIEHITDLPSSSIDPSSATSDPSNIIQIAPLPVASSVVSSILSFPSIVTDIHNQSVPPTHVHPIPSIHIDVVHDIRDTTLTSVASATPIYPYPTSRTSYTSPPVPPARPLLTYHPGIPPTSTLRAPHYAWLRHFLPSKHLGIGTPVTAQPYVPILAPNTPRYCHWQACPRSPAADILDAYASNLRIHGFPFNHQHPLPHDSHTFAEEESAAFD